MKDLKFGGRGIEMYYIVVYDIAEKRVNKVLKFMRKFKFHTGSMLTRI